MILNQQHRVRLRTAGLDAFLSQACRAVRLPIKSLTICFVGSAKIGQWNLAYRGKRGPTDVLSFPTGIPPRSARRNPAAPAYLGDIAICPAVAQQNARRFGRTLDGELRILILHGILHLMGYDHETDSGQMERRESRLRRALGLG